MCDVISKICTVQNYPQIKRARVQAKIWGWAGLQGPYDRRTGHLECCCGVCLYRFTGQTVPDGYTSHIECVLVHQTYAEGITRSLWWCRHIVQLSAAIMMSGSGNFTCPWQILKTYGGISKVPLGLQRVPLNPVEHCGDTEMTLVIT